MDLNTLKKHANGFYGLKCGRIRGPRMDVWIRGDHSKGIIVHHDGRCDPWHVDGSRVVSDPPFRLKADWKPDRKARELRARLERDA